MTHPTQTHVGEGAKELAEARRLLAWVYARTRHGCFNFKRSERDAALSDVNFWTAPYKDYWRPSNTDISRNLTWCGERP